MSAVVMRAVSQWSEDWAFGSLSLREEQYLSLQGLTTCPGGQPPSLTLQAGILAYLLAGQWDAFLREAVRA